jgi:hypothetical protein
MENNKSVTAVEWLIGIYLTTGIDRNVHFHQAKEMEKEQIIDAFVECWKLNVPDGIECKVDAQQYYNETFKSE